MGGFIYAVNKVVCDVFISRNISLKPIYENIHVGFYGFMDAKIIIQINMNIYCS